MQLFFELFATFFKIGMFTIGGGYAMLPVIQREVVETKGWLTEDAFLDTISLTNSLPGPLATNCATFVGYRVAGKRGAGCAILGAMVPSVMIILVIAALFQNFMEYQVVRYIFLGIRPAVAALILFSLMRLQRSARVTKEFNWIMTAFGFFAMAIFKLHPVIIVIVAASYGLFLRQRLLTHLLTLIQKGVDAE